jgi:hypothetical protein
MRRIFDARFRAPSFDPETMATARMTNEPWPLAPD